MDLRKGLDLPMRNPPSSLQDLPKGLDLAMRNPPSFFKSHFCQRCFKIMTSWSLYPTVGGISPHIVSHCDVCKTPNSGPASRWTTTTCKTLRLRRRARALNDEDDE